MTPSVSGATTAVCTGRVVRWKAQTWNSPWSKLIVSTLHVLGRSRLPAKARAQASTKRPLQRPLAAVRQARNLHAAKRKHALDSYTRLRLSQAAGRGVVCGANDQGLVEMTAPLNALSIGVHEGLGI